MEAVHVIAVVGIVISFMQAIIIMLLVGLKGELNDVWDRVYNHYHIIECDNRDCTALHTGNVVVPQK